MPYYVPPCPEGEAGSNMNGVCFQPPHYKMSLTSESALVSTLVGSMSAVVCCTNLEMHSVPNNILHLVGVMMFCFFKTSSCSTTNYKQKKRQHGQYFFTHKAKVHQGNNALFKCNTVASVLASDWILTLAHMHNNITPFPLHHQYGIY